MKRILPLLIFASACQMASPTPTPTPAPTSVTLAWDAESVPVAGYRLHWGLGSDDFTDNLEVDGNTTTATVSGLAPNTQYEFAVTAFDAAGNESDFSNRVYWPQSSVQSMNVNLKVMP